MGRSAQAARIGWRRVLACAWPALVPLALAGIYLWRPSFYFRYVLEHERREYQFVELATVTCAFLAAGLLTVAGVRAWRAGSAARRAGLVPARNPLDGRGGAAVILFLAAGSFFFAGEEISWGQTYLGWETEHKESNLHNTVPISFPGLGSAVIVLILVAMPVVWRWRDRLPVPRDWAPAVAEWPVVSCVFIAFAVSWVKDAARHVVHLSDDAPHAAYFFELNEQKEMLIALALLIYGVYRLRATRTERPR